MVLTDTGLAKVFQRIKSFVIAQLNSKASAIHTHTSSEITDLSNGYVNLSTAQSVDGQKIFTHGATGLGRDSYHFATSPYGKNTPPANTSYQYVFFHGNTASQGFTNSWYGGYIEQVIGTDGLARGRWLIRDTSESALGIELFVNGSDKQVRPMQNNVTDLGTSTNKWKSLNGINPGALSLPSISSSGANAWIALDTTDWVKNTAVSFAQKYTPLADGWLNVRVDNATMLAIAVGGNYMHQMIRSETANSLALLMPVFKNTEVAIMVGGNENLAYNRVTFYYCQGNV